ncbi:CPBP family intramembrane glutamic endopeptidase [Allomeiothermus silvanus]|uniref:CPBP family intramembrane glutamic endopeptidase n=1 Tax=Allomeiothermus silvanus TaxID=52022 RepID=UPI0023F14C01|nr:CPBP family intramembrane glutamic endopeptidase [Allomeiothermus silvanus]
MLAVFVTLLVLLTAYLLNNTASRTEAIYRGYRNSVMISFIAFSLWLAFDHWFIPGSWWTISGSTLLAVICLTLGAMAINILLYRWYMGGSDYPGLVQAGVVSDGCPYNGPYAIPKNFVTHGGATLWEEIIFRGVIGLGLYFIFGPIVSIVVTSVFFGLLHYLPFRAYAKHNSIKPDRYVLGAFISPSLFPAAFMAVNLFYGSLIPGWIMHWGLNCSVGLYLRYILPAISNKGAEKEYVG